MCFTNFLLIVLGVCLIAKEAQCDCKDDPPAINEQLYGPNMCCFFGIGSTADFNKMKSLSKSVKKIGIGYWPKHKLAFAIYSTDGFYVTAVEDGTCDLYGVAYLLSMEDYADLLKDTMYNQEKIGHAATAKVTMEGNTIIDCNVLSFENQEVIKPSKSNIKFYTDIFKAAGFPSNYIDKFSQQPTSD